MHVHIVHAQHIGQGAISPYIERLSHGISTSYMSAVACNPYTSACCVSSARACLPYIPALHPRVHSIYRPKPYVRPFCVRSAAALSATLLACMLSGKAACAALLRAHYQLQPCVSIACTPTWQATATGSTAASPLASPPPPRRSSRRSRRRRRRRRRHPSRHRHPSRRRRRRRRRRRKQVRRPWRAGARTAPRQPSLPPTAGRSAAATTRRSCASSSSPARRAAYAYIHTYVYRYR